MSYGSTVYDPNFKAKFFLRLKNIGISLYNPQISLELTSSDKEIMRVIIEMSRKEEKTGNVDQFAKGMIAEFTYERDYYFTPDTFISEAIQKHLADPKHRIYVTVSSQQFEVAKFRLNGIKSKIIKKYNAFICFMCEKWFRYIRKTRDEIKIQNNVFDFAKKYQIKDFCYKAEEFLTFFIDEKRKEKPAI